MSQSYFVTGATGHQGGATVDALLALNKSLDVHVLVRDTTSPAAQRLSSLGPNVKVFQGDHDSIDTIKAAASGCTGAFLNVTPSFSDPNAEVRHAENIIAACKATGTVKRLVYSSSSGLNARHGIWEQYVQRNPQSFMSNYMISKRACEEATTKAASDFLKDGSTILRPAFFYTNIVAPSSARMFPTLATDNKIITGLRPDFLQSCLDPADIGALAARILCDPRYSERWAGKIIPMGAINESMSDIVPKMNAAIQKLSGGKSNKEIELVQVPEEEVKAKAEAGDLWMGSFAFQNDWSLPYNLDVDVFSLIGDEIKWTTWEQFFDREKTKLEAAIGGF